jgi:dTDP-4-amino-4,6-dideoxygalactose transaminase
MTIPFNTLAPVQDALSEEIEAATRRVLGSGRFILGPEVEAFEQAFARYHAVAEAVAVGSGTDALELALRAAGIGPGDEVITVAQTAVATVCAVERSGARPVLVEIDPFTYTMDAAAARAAITARTRAIVPVHLYGHPAAMHELSQLARQYGLFLLEDCAQAHGARYDGRLVGTIGHAGAFSFYPTKNLGACGDGGAIITGDRQLAARLRRLRNYGQSDRYHHAERGINSRLDELQAAVLSVKLPHLDLHNQTRRSLAACYRRHLRGVRLPAEGPGGPPIQHVYHLYVVRCAERDALRAELEARGIGTLIHYPLPVHRQPAYADLGYGPGSLPITEAIAGEVLSLPMYVGLRPSEVETVCQAVAEIVEGALV